MRLSVLCGLGFGLVFVAACRVPQEPGCATYVSCQAAYDDALELERVDTERFSDTGACWTHPDVAAQCLESCSRAIDAILEVADELDEPARGTIQSACGG